MYDFAYCAADTVDLVEVQLHWKKLRHLRQARPWPTHWLHGDFRRLLVLDEVALLAPEQVVTCHVHKRILDAVEIGRIDAEINTPENFVNDLLVLRILEPHKLLPLLYTIFPRRKFSHSKLKCQWTVLLHLVDAFKVLFLVVLLNFFFVFWIKVCPILIIECVLEQILMLVVNVYQFIHILI